MILGQNTEYLQTYSPEILYPVARSQARSDLTYVPPYGNDVWRGWELSWLNPKGKPVFARAAFSFPSSTPYLVESKSFKLYLNSFNQTSFPSIDAVKRVLEKDLSDCVQGPVSLELFSCEEPPLPFALSGICLDDLDIETNVYDVDPDLLKTGSEFAEETLYSRLLKSNCLVTGQPDWGTALIRYSGAKICQESLLKYIISFRKHSGFAEHCVESLYSDIMEVCRPEKLTVAIAYTRRGGLDINPVRSNSDNCLVPSTLY